MHSKSYITVRYAETDRMGVAHHANYPIWYEVGRTDFIKMFGTTYTEMEAAGVALTAFRNDIPCYLLKIISDNADENAINDFDTSLSKKNEEFEKILKRVIETL